MAMQWAPGVRVNCVCPGMIETPMTRALLDDPAFREAVLLKYPLQRFGQPDEVASAILYLASDEASFVTGVSLPGDGGYTAGGGGAHWRVRLRVLRAPTLGAALAPVSHRS